MSEMEDNGQVCTLETVNTFSQNLIRSLGLAPSSDGNDN